MKRKSVSPKTKCKILKRDNYTCAICGFTRVYTMMDVQDHYKKNFGSFIIFKNIISRNPQNTILKYIDYGGDINDIVLTWLSPQGLEIDHIRAVCNGGGDEYSNLQCLCTKCHKTKTGKDLATLSKKQSYKKIVPHCNNSEKDEIKRRLAGWLL